MTQVLQANRWRDLEVPSLARTGGAVRSWLLFHFRFLRGCGLDGDFTKQVNLALGDFCRGIRAGRSKLGAAFVQAMAFLKDLVTGHLLVAFSLFLTFSPLFLSFSCIFRVLLELLLSSYFH